MNKLADAYLAHPKCITCGECITTHEWQNLCNIRTGRNDEPLFQVDPLDDYCARHTSLAEQDYSFAGTIQQINRQLDYLRMLCERAVDAAKFEAEKGIDDGNT